MSACPYAMYQQTSMRHSSAACPLACLPGRYMYAESFGRWQSMDLLIGLAYLSGRENTTGCYPAADIANRGLPLSTGQTNEKAQALLVSYAALRVEGRGFEAVCLGCGKATCLLGCQGRSHMTQVPSEPVVVSRHIAEQ